MVSTDSVERAHDGLTQAIDMLASGRRGIVDRLHRALVHALQQVDPIGSAEDSELSADITQTKDEIAAAFDGGMSEDAAVEFAHRLVTLNDRVARVYWTQQGQS